jgi:hypothetical protein
MMTLAEMDKPHKESCLYYPRSHKGDDEPDVIVALYDVRAADDIRITYDFSRDGWVIWQAKRTSWPGDDTVCDPLWTEVAFCQAWQVNEEVQHESI